MPRACGLRRIQWRAALEKILVKRPGVESAVKRSGAEVGRSDWEGGRVSVDGALVEVGWERGGGWTYAVGDSEGDVGEGGVLFPRRLDHGGGGVEAEDRALWDERGDVRGEGPVAAADVEDVVGGLRGEVGEDGLGELGDEGGGGVVFLEVGK